MSEASEQLRNNQKQLDADGIMVGVSRQAVDETLAQYRTLVLLAAQYRDDLLHPPVADSVQRRIERINAVLKLEE